MSPGTLSLALGSGGARGLVHVGVIRELEAAGYRIDSIAGCSMGALVGGVYALGKLDEFTDWVTSIKRLDMLRLLDLTWGSEGLMKGERVIGALTRIVGNAQIEDLPIKYTAVAADINREREVWLNSGPLFTAIRASMSLPLIFTPVRHGDALLVDGGVLNPVPIAPTFHDDTTLTLAVNLCGRPRGESGDAVTEMEETESPGEDSPIHRRIRQFIDQLGFSEESPAPAPRSDFYTIANQAFDAMQGHIAQQKLAAYPPNHLIEVPRDTCGTFEFDRAEEMIALGHSVTREWLAGLSG